MAFPSKKTPEALATIRSMALSHTRPAIARAVGICVKVLCRWAVEEHIHIANRPGRPRGAMKKTRDIVERIRNLAPDHSSHAISRIVGVSRKSVCKWARQEGIEIYKPPVRERPEVECPAWVPEKFRSQFFVLASRGSEQRAASQIRKIIHRPSLSGAAPPA